MGPGKHQFHCTEPVLTELSNWAKIAIGYSVTMAFCKEHSSESLHQSMTEGLVVGSSLVFIKTFTLFLNWLFVQNVLDGAYEKSW